MFLDSLWMPLASALLGGLLAVTGAFFAQRYHHHLGDRATHHDELKQHVLKPWKEECQRQRWKLNDPNRTWHDLTRVAWEGGYESIMEPPFSMTSPFNPQSPLPFQTRPHWPGLHAAWQSIQQEITALEAGIMDTVDDLRRVLPNPPKEGTWDYEHPVDDDFGARRAAAQLWNLHWQVQDERHRTRQEAFIQQAKGQQFWSHELQGEQHAVIKAAATLLFSTEMQHNLQGLARQARIIATGLDRFSDKMERYIHDRNLHGTCSLCKSLIPRLRLRTRIMWLKYRLQRPAT